MPTMTSAGVTPQDVLRVLYRHKGKTLVFFCGVVTATVLYTLLSPKVYRSDSELFVRLGRENTTVDSVATLGKESPVAIPASRENEINTLVEIFQNRTLLERVVDAVGVEVILAGRPVQSGPAVESQSLLGNLLGNLAGWVQRLSSPMMNDRERALLALSRDMAVEPVKKSNILRVSYQAKDPEVARKVVSSLVDLYLEQHIRLNRTQGANEFLAEQADRCRRQLGEAESRLCSLQNRTGLASPEAQRQLLVSRVAQLEDQLLQARSALDGSSAELRVLEEKLRSMSPTQVASRTAGTPDNGTDMMRQQRYTLELSSHQRASIYTEAHPKMQEMLAQLPGATRTLAREPREHEQVVTAISRPYEEVQIALLRQLPIHASLQAKAGVVEGQLAQTQQQLRSLNDTALQLVQLQREVDVQTGQWKKYAATLEQARMDQSLETSKISNLSVVQPASCSLKPVSPRMGLSLVLGLLAATFGAFGLAMTAEYFDHTFQSVDDLERALDLPALTAIPLVNSPRMNGNGRKPHASVRSS